MQTDPSPEHAWLKQLVGDWRFEHEFSPGPGEPTIKLPGREKVRMMGDLWVVFEGGGEMHTGDEMSYLMTLGFDPNKGAYVGSWIGSPMAHRARSRRAARRCRSRQRGRALKIRPSSFGTGT